MASPTEIFEKELLRTNAVSIAAARALSDALQSHEFSTIMGLDNFLKETVISLKQSFLEYGKREFSRDHFCGLHATCALFYRTIIKEGISAELKRVSNEEFRPIMIKKGLELAMSAENASTKIISEGIKFVPITGKILVHGLSQIILEFLKKIRARTKDLEIYITKSTFEKSPSAQIEICSELDLKIIDDRSIGFHMEKMELILVGCLGVCENGGIINDIGTFPIAIVAKTFRVPMYVAAERLKFTRMFPISQQDLQDQLQDLEEAVLDEESKSSSSTQNQKVVADFTPPDYLRLLFTDAGVFSPSAVSDELIKLYQ